MDFLEGLAGQGLFQLPARRKRRARQSIKSVTAEEEEQAWVGLTGSVEEFSAVEVNQVQSRGDRQLFRGLVDRYHYLGYRVPYGARMQYLVYLDTGQRTVVGCIQFSSPAWRMKVRDQWIGWDDATRGERLQHVVNNSRFLVLPRIRNLAGTMLSCVLKRLRSDWREQYGVDPWLVETLVDRQRFHGGCYLASNWTWLGETSGRGRMDRGHERHGTRVKTVLVYPLVKDALRRLTDGQGR